MGRGIRTAAAAVWLGLLLTVPVLAAGPETLVPVGRTVGLELETDGLYVVKFDETESPSPAEQAGLRIGDRLLRANGAVLTSARDLTAQVEAAAGDPVVLELEREGRSMELALCPQRKAEGWRLGLCVRDRISGLGTVTFYDPETGLFGALGHGVNVCEGCPMEIRGGQATRTAVTQIRKGSSGAPGSLLGPATGGETLGRVERNTERGLFGHGNGQSLPGSAVPLAQRREVRSGPAEIWCSVAGSEPQAYAVEIEAVREDPEQYRDLRLVVTDPRLLEQTGGIVQGMSGSPILQDGKLVGAVTHVLVRDPTRGYGILIGHMLEAANPEAEAA